MLIGGVSLKYNFQLVGLVRLQWVESKLGYGSSYIVYKVISVIMVLAGVIIIAGFGDNILDWATAPLRGIFPR